MAIAELPIASQPIADSLVGAPVVVVVPPGQVLLAGQIAPARRQIDYLPALAPFIPAPITDLPRSPNFTRYYDWRRGPAVRAQADVWQVLPQNVPQTVAFRTAHFSRYNRRPSTGARAQDMLSRGNLAAFTPAWFQVFTG